MDRLWVRYRALRLVSRILSELPPTTPRRAPKAWSQLQDGLSKLVEVADNEDGAGTGAGGVVAGPLVSAQTLENILQALRHLRSGQGWGGQMRDEGWQRCLIPLFREALLPQKKKPSC